MKLKKYSKCYFCNSSNLKLHTNQKFHHNFYTRAIKNDFNLKDSFFLKMKVYRCQKCKIIQNNPWFSYDDSFKIFNQIYGQHNRNWSNILNFFNKGKKPNHGNLFSMINQKIKIKKYAEFNSPFMGLMINFFHKEHSSKNAYFFKKIFDTSLKYLSSRQLVGLNKNKLKENTKLAKKFFNDLKKLKLTKKKKIKKTLFVDNSHLSWLYNDNYKSINSKTLASGLFDMNIKNINQNKKEFNFDLFGIFHTLDHTHQPKFILDYALKNSKYVIIYCHIDEELEKQHLFSLTSNFMNYLKSRKIKVFDLTSLINKRYKSPEQYILCSQKHKLPFFI